MHTIIPRPPLETILKELRPELLCRQTNKANNLVYDFHASEAPTLMQEVGRLREMAFRMAGGGTGKSVDIDELDTHPDGYRQLIVWDPQDREIIGGYRYIAPRTSDCKLLSTEHYFEFSETFRQKYLPITIELGRSFIQPNYQARGAKGLFALDNLWDGLGALINQNPDIKYLFGKVTMYGDYNIEARNMLIFFLKKHFPDTENLLQTKYPVHMDINHQQMEELFDGENYEADYKILQKNIRDFKETVPPLINAYMSLSPSMKVFDTAVNPDFGDVEETAILITIDDLYPRKIERHMVY